MKHSDIGVHDPIDESFPVMVDASKRFCRGRNSPDDPCFIYHRLWPYRRRLGLHTWQDARHFLDSFRNIVEQGHPKQVLISGCADYSVLAWVLHAFRENRVVPQITVLDVCEAPLVVNRWYAERLDAKIDTIVCDILEYQSDTAFDVVTTSNFLGQFGPSERSRLLAKWHALLRPGGNIVGVQSVSDDASIRDTNDIKRRCAKILRLAQENGSLIDIAPETLAEYQEKYSGNRRHFPALTKRIFEDLFEDSGFRIDTAVSLSNREKRDWAELRGKRQIFDRIRFVATKVH